MGIKFSIIIPATRPECVNFAIESAINQNFKKNEYEIILIDNSLSGLKKIIPLEYLKNIKYFKTKKYLTVEKNWEFGFSKAKGFWQLMLCDDDIIAVSHSSEKRRRRKAQMLLDPVRWLPNR